MLSLREFLKERGATILSGSRAAVAGSLSARLSLDNPSLHAPRPELVMRALKAWRNTPENVADHDDFVAAIAAIKASLGPRREEFRADVIEWSHDYPGNPDGYADKVWDSINEASIGWDWLAPQARAAGFSDAEEIWEDAPPEWRDDEAPRQDSTPENVAAEIKPTLFVCRDPAEIPRRQWLYDRHYIRRFASATIAPGGTGKSILLLTEAVAMATGKNLLRVKHMPAEPLRVWYWNGEDPVEEIERRIAAIRLHFGLNPDDFGDRLFIDSGRDTEIVIAREKRGEFVICRPLLERLLDAVRSRGIDALLLDPFVASHGVSENDNTKIAAIGQQWSALADKANCAVGLAHHARKPGSGQTELTTDDARGASALIGVVRCARVLNRMGKTEAERAGIENPGWFFRVDDGKTNLTPPADRSEWYGHVSVALGNGRGPAEPGDSVGVVEAWDWPDASQELSTADIEAIQAEVRAGTWREDSQASDWVGKPVAKIKGLDLTKKADREATKSILRTLFQIDALKRVPGKDAHSKPRWFVVIGKKMETIEW